MNWQPIETAPKDTTEILVYGDERIFLVYWYLDEWINGDVTLGWAEIDPTHWMPLPSPPGDTQ